MAPIKQLILSGVEFGASARYIADVFRVNSLATSIRIVKDETYSPSYSSAGKFNINDRLETKALVHIDYWEDTEAAYDFIKKIRSENKATLKHPGGIWVAEELEDDDYSIIPAKYEMLWDKCGDDETISSTEVDWTDEVNQDDCNSEDCGMWIYPEYIEPKLVRWNPPCCAEESETTDECEYCINLDAMEMV
jgi:hypothetical protein